MKKIMDKLDSALINVQFRARNFISNQRGDTNFISIAIILIIVLAIAAVFITYGNQLKDKLETAFSDLMKSLGSGETPEG